MSLPKIVSRDVWLEERRALLTREKAMTRERDALNAQRRDLPMVRVDDDYEFTDLEGTHSLLDLFAGRRQLVVQHFMFDPSWDDGCPSCTAAASEISGGLLEHLAVRDTTVALVSRAPIDRIERYRTAKGWDLRWYSSYGSRFNYDFHVTLDSTVAPVQYNFRDESELEAHGLGWMNEGSSEQPGYSMFLRDGDDVFHTYSVFARGTEMLGGSYAWLDLTALGRQEDWELPKGRASATRGAVPDFSS